MSVASEARASQSISAIADSFRSTPLPVRWPIVHAADPGGRQMSGVGEAYKGNHSYNSASAKEERLNGLARRVQAQAGLARRSGQAGELRRSGRVPAGGTERAGGGPGEP